MFLTLAVLVTASVRGQYNPTSPAEPGVAYTLTLEAYPKDAGSFNLNTTTLYQDGSNVAVRAYTNTGYRFVGWEQDGKVISTAPSLYYIMPPKNVQLIAHFKYDPSNPMEPDESYVAVYSELTLVSLPQTGGYFNISSGNRYEVGTTVQLRAYANSNYTFRNWTVNGEVVSTSSSFQYVIEKDSPVLVANYDYNPSSPSEPQGAVFIRKLNLNSNPIGGGYFNISSGNEYESGSSVYIRAYSNQYYTFLNWSLGDSVVSESSSFNYLMPDSETTLTANYSYNYSPSSPSEPQETDLEQVNIYGMTENVVRGQTITYPVYLENDIEIRGVFVDLTFPSGFLINTEGVLLSGRVPDHELEIIELGENGYRFRLLGNSRISGNNGKILDIPITVPDTAKMGNTYPVALTHGVMCDMDNSQTHISARNGNIYVEKKNEDGLYARFSIDKLHNRVKFINQSSSNSVSYLWDFGDGTTSEERDPMHVYESAGFYDVKLTVKGEYDEDIADMTVLINEENSWTTEGAFFLSSSESGVRYFTSAQNLFDFICSSIIIGNIKVSIQADMAFQYRVSSEETDSNYIQLKKLHEILKGNSYTFSFSKYGSGGKPAFSFGESGAQNDTVIVDFFSELGKNMICDSVDIKLGNILFEELYVNRSLALELSKYRVNENEGDEIAIKLNRSRMWAATESFNITVTPDSRITTVPAEVTIPANQSGAVLFFKIDDNDILDNDSIITISVEGNGYPTVQTQLLIDDNEYPDLYLTASKEEVTEGDTLLLTVTTSRISSTPIIVNITSENSKQFKFPQRIVIPEGDKSATIVVETVDDALPDLTIWNTFYASSSKYNNAHVEVALKDNDMPLLELLFTPDVVQENAGVVSVAGVLRRTTNQDSKITVKLTDDSGGGLFFGNNTLELAKGVEEIHFNFGPVDNARVDGDRTYTVTAAVWLSSCSCDVWGESAGNVETAIKVLDNDGPALTLNSSLTTLKEGGVATLTVSRNTDDLSNPLSVTIVSDFDEGISCSQSAIIPAGRESVTIEVVSEINDVSGDSHTVVFTAHADGYATGTCFLMITDQTLPDVKVSSLTADVSEMALGSNIDLTMVLVNEGVIDMPAGLTVKIYRRGYNVAVTTFKTVEEIPSGGRITLDKKISLPTSVGINYYYVVLNESNELHELSYANNTSSDVSIITLSPYEVSVSTDKVVYNQGETVLISGGLIGDKIANSSVEVYLINDNVRQSQVVTTDEEGRFSFGWDLYALQSGHFIVGACYPEEGLNIEMASFDVYGLHKADNSFITCETKLGEDYKGTINVVNPGLLEQSVKSFEIIDKPEGCEVTLETPDRIEANGLVEFKYGLHGTVVTQSDDWEVIKLRITTNEGSVLDVPLYYYCAAQNAVLTSDLNEINTTMTIGTTREYSITVMNTGKGATGIIDVLIPDNNWMKLGSQCKIPSLEYGETAIISLLLSPTKDMVLNVPYTGIIGLNCENGNGISINYHIEAVSEATGNLIIDVVDEYTYYTTEKPHVANADVQIIHPSSNIVIAEGKTDSNGVFSIDLPEGYYHVKVSEGHHNSVSGDVLVDPGKTNYQEVFVSYNAIEYSWNVVETTIDDEYRIETTVKYETNVPKPVVLITLPSERPEIGSIIPVVVTNKGLINAQHVDIHLDCSTDYELEVLNPEQLELLAPQQSYVFYAKFSRPTTSHASIRAAGNPDIDCVSVFADALYDYICGNETTFGEALAQNKWGNCWNDMDGTPSSPSKWRIKPVPHTTSWPSGPSGGAKGPKSWPRNDTPVINAIRGAYCNMPCAKELTEALVCEAVDRVVPDWLKCSYNLINQSIYGDMMGRIEAILDCAGISNPISCWMPYLECMLHYSQSNRSPIRMVSNTETNIKNRGYETALNLYNSEEMVLREWRAYRRIIEEYFGSAKWLECDNSELAGILNFISSNDSNYVYSLFDFRTYNLKLISEPDLMMLVERLNNTAQFKQSGYNGVVNYINNDTVDYYSAIIQQCEDEAINKGWNNLGEMYSVAYEELKDYLDEGSNSVCATVTLQFNQTMVMTRQAFRGTLTVFNGSEDAAMENVKLTLNVTNKRTGQIATSHEFQINTESLEGFSGELDFSSGWNLDANSTGTATVLFIPTKFAAPEESENWSFGGNLRYVDPFTGLEVTRDLFPVTLTVNPSPELDLTYFMQRDVYGDDPLTPDVVEPMVPAEFALLINNKGNGDANNVRMVTQQPEIIENKKGLLIDFELISSQINGGDASLSFGKVISNDFGSIKAHSQMYAQWWLTSTLLGHFVEYDVKATHVTSFGNEELSLLDKVTIHELVHGFNVLSDNDNPMRGFLVNDISDAQDLPDEVYFTDATHQRVFIGSANLVKLNELEYVLDVDVENKGWNYGSIPDPTEGKQKLVKVVRSDGTEVNVDNIWQTDRTLRDGKDWLYENRLHFVGNISADGETFYLTFEPKPDVELEVDSFDGVPEEGEVLMEQLTELTVKFNKPVQSESFTANDIVIRCQGVILDASCIEIIKLNDQEFKLKLNDATIQDGYYVLTVQTDGIEDMEGFYGSNGKSATWIQLVEGKVTLIVSSSPDNGGKVTPSSGRYDYDSDVTLKATPADGYDFIGWKSADGVTVSTEMDYTVHLVSDTELKALFSIRHYNVKIGSDSKQGVVNGASSGIYEYGTELKLWALPENGFEFDSWLIDGVYKTNDNPYLVTVEGDIDINALFTVANEIKVISAEDGTKLIITPLPLGEQMFIIGDFNEIYRVSIYDMRGAKCLESLDVKQEQGVYTGMLKSGVYLVQIVTDKGVHSVKVIKK